MPSWKKVLVSGSSAHLNQITGSAFRIDGNTNYAKMVDRDNGSYGEFGVTNPHIGVNFQYYAA